MKDIFCKDTNETFQSYGEYLRSRHWAAVKERYRKSNLPQCCLSCYSKDKPTDMHHKSYNRLGNEKLMDLIPLCRDCHSKTHSVEKSGKRNLWGAHRVVRKKSTRNGSVVQFPWHVIYNAKSAKTDAERKKILVEYAKLFCVERNMSYNVQIQKAVERTINAIKRGATKF